MQDFFLFFCFAIFTVFDWSLSPQGGQHSFGCQMHTAAQDVRTSEYKDSQQSGWRGEIKWYYPENISSYFKEKVTLPAKKHFKYFLVLCQIQMNGAKWTQTQGTWVERDELPWASRQLVLSWVCWREAKPLWGLSWKPIVSQHTTRIDNFKIRATLMPEASCRWPGPGALWSLRHRDNQSLSSVP